MTKILTDSNGKVLLNTSGKAYIAPEGGGGTSVPHPDPTISVNTSTGLITASHTQASGQVTGGTTTATEQLTTQGAQIITPTTSDQTIAAGKFLTGTQTIEGDADLVAGNIKSGVSIFGVTGTYQGGGATNIATGTFTGTTTGSAMDVSITYTGNGYPLAIIIAPTAGAYNSNETIYNALQRYAVIEYAAYKAVATATPDYSTNSNICQACVMSTYKTNSTNATSYSRGGGPNIRTYRNTSATASNTLCVQMKSKNTMSVFIASSSYGFMANVQYTYWIIYSS